MTSSRLREVKTKENCKLSSLKVVVVAYKRWSLTGGSNYRALTEKKKKWYFGNVVAQERWSQGEV